MPSTSPRIENPCPCGYLGDATRGCACSPFVAERYWRKLSGPLLDRIDLQVEVPRLGEDDLMSVEPAEPSATIRARVLAARARQAERFADAPGIYRNSRMGTREIRAHCKLDGPSRELLRQAISKLGLSGRSFDRILKVARTVADLAGEEAIRPVHMAEAIQYRLLDRRGA